MSGRQGGWGGAANRASNYCLSSLQGGWVSPPLTASDCIALDRVTLLSVRGGNIGDLDEKNASWRTGLSYKPTDNAMLYVNVTKGYKAGSFPMLSASTSYQYLPVKQESVLDYEGGFKASFFDHSLQLNGAAFLYD